MGIKKEALELLFVEDQNPKEFRLQLFKPYFLS